MNIGQLKEYIRDLPDDMEIAVWDNGDYNIVHEINIQEETPYMFIGGNPYYKKADKQKLLILE